MASIQAYKAHKQEGTIVATTLIGGGSGGGARWAVAPNNFVATK